MPLVPSTSKRSPSLMMPVTPGNPLTQGRPYSRAMMAPCCSPPPTYSTTAEALTKTGVQDGSVATVTRISPGSSGFS